jgi:serralysin
MTAGTYSDFLTALGQNESGNNYGFVSSLGYLGRYQFGEEALKAIGFYDGDNTPAIDFVGAWTATAATFGVFDKAEFLASPAAQDAAAAAWFVKIGVDLDSLDLGRFDGQTIDGIPITTSGLLAGAHLVGVWALRDFLQSGGAIDTTDGYGTPVSQYVQRFGGFDTPIVLKDDPTSAPSGPAQLIGTAAADTLTAGAGPNYVRGGDGDDAIHGGAGFDDINGNQGNDTIDGGSGGGDWLVGGQGDDRIVGHGGGEVIYGNLGADTLMGGGAGDVVRGGQGDDSIVAGSGAEWLSGDRGDDTLQAGSGPDVFHTFAEAGVDRVIGFKPGIDHVQLDPGTHYVVSQAGADTVIDMGAGNEMVLVGVPMSSLAPGWIFGA